MRIVFAILLVGALATRGIALAAPPGVTAGEPVRTVAAWNLGKNRLAIQGYDPVAYFPEGGGAAVKGDDTITTEYRGAVYRFASAAHRDIFLADPARYEPAHGGWCSYAMIGGDKVQVDPRSFIVKDGRLFLFYKGLLGDTRAKWLKADHAAQSSKADVMWKKLTGESPRPDDEPRPR